MGNNTYMKKLHMEKQLLLDVGIQCGKQQMADYLTLVLRDPLYVDKDIHGRNRIEKIIAGLEAYDREFSEAYTVGREADYYQEKLDGLLRQVYGDDLVPFHERQPHIIQTKYDKKKKGWVD